MANNNSKAMLTKGPIALPMADITTCKPEKQNKIWCQVVSISKISLSKNKLLIILQVNWQIIRFLSNNHDQGPSRVFAYLVTVLLTTMYPTCIFYVSTQYYIVCMQYVMPLAISITNTTVGMQVCMQFGNRKVQIFYI